MEILENRSLRSFNTFGIAAEARWFASIQSEVDLHEIILDKRWNRLPKLVLGGGSNVLLQGDFAGLVLNICVPGKRIVDENADELILEVGAGEQWHDLVMHCVGQNWAGIENLSLIPGKLGAAPIQNIGAYGVELKDVFVYLEAMDLESGEIRRFEKAECQFGYRDSLFKRELKGKMAILRVGIRLQKRNHVLNTSYGAIGKELAAAGIKAPTIKDVSDVVIAIRQSKLPDPQKIGNAGSFFKNPEVPTSFFDALKARFPEMPGYVVSTETVKIPAGWLIDQAGWKGKRFGNYGVHAAQALVLVNYGGAQGDEIYALSSKIQASVQARYGIALSREVNVV